VFIIYSNLTLPAILFSVGIIDSPLYRSCPTALGFSFENYRSALATVIGIVKYKVVTATTSWKLQHIALC
jgi:hypothetical protein